MDEPPFIPVSQPGPRCPVSRRHHDLLILLLPISVLICLLALVQMQFYRYDPSPLPHVPGATDSTTRTIRALTPFVEHEGSLTLLCVSNRTAQTLPPMLVAQP